MKIKSLFSLLVICLLIPLVAPAQKLLTMDDISNFALYPQQLRNLKWVGETNRFAFIRETSLIEGQTGSKDEKVLLTLEQLNEDIQAAGLGKMRRFPNFTRISDGSFWFMYGSKMVFFDLKERKATVQLDLPDEADNTEFEMHTMQAAYSLEDDIYIRTKDQTIRVTHDGGNGIVNGRTVHRNEFGISNGLFWSPKGSLLAFYRKDESMVAQYPLVDIDTRIAQVNYIRYPMAGMNSEEVTVGIFNPGTGKTIFLETGEPKNQYLTNITWSPDETSIYIAVLNREQNLMKLIRYNAVTGKPELTLFEETSAMYVEPEHGPLFLPNNPKQFIWQSERNGWNHLYLYDTDGKLLKRFTSGDWMVTSVEGFDLTGNLLFFTSTAVSPLESHYFQLDLKREKITQITQASGTHTVQHSADGKYFLDQYSNFTGIAGQTDLLDAKGKLIRTLYENIDPLKEYQKAEIIIDTLKASDGTPLYYRMLLPPGFDKNKKYPVFFYLYGGPHNQLVTNSWLGGAGLFLTYMAHQGYIVFTLDNRGTANRGFQFESVIHRKLGIIESEDQMKGVEYLRSLPYIDARRMGIHGWSYGGFMTITMMHRYPGVFAAAVAGGPVIDWKYYEVMYGERYMDTPEENPKGYENSSLLTSLDSLQGRLMLIHGTLDDVVVWQHSQAYLKKSVEKKKLVDYYIYPGHDHGVRGADRAHLNRKIEQYMKDHLE